MLKSKARIVQASKSKTVIVYVSSRVATDFLFPFKKLPANVVTSINGGQLIIEKAEVEVEN